MLQVPLAGVQHALGADRYVSSLASATDAVATLALEIPAVAA